MTDNAKATIILGIVMTINILFIQSQRIQMW